METDRFEFLMLNVFDNDNARELLQFLRDGLCNDAQFTNYLKSLGNNNYAIATDPNGLDAVKAMAKLNLIQSFLDFPKNYKSNPTQGE